MRALVISGGGAKGAFAGGLAENLIYEKGNKYDMFLGTSTGSLLVTHLALGKLSRLKKSFTTVGMSDIFDVCPFIIKDGPEGKISKINHWHMLWQFIKRRKTFGESHALRKRISQTISPEDFKMAKALNQWIVITVSNLTTNKVEYKYIRDCDYDEFLDWIWISCNFVPFMTLAEKNGMEYADGGFGNLIPIQEAINLGATEVDVIVLSTRHTHVRKPKSTNPFGVLLSTLDFMLHQIRRDDVFIGHLESIYNEVKVNFFYTPTKLTENSFIFDIEQMSNWWIEGLEFGRSLE